MERGVRVVIVPRHAVDGIHRRGRFTPIHPCPRWWARMETQQCLLLLLAGTRFAPVRQGGSSAPRVGINHFMKIRTAGLVMTLALCMGADVMQK